VDFLDEHGQLDALGGWLAEAMPLRGRTIVCYHKNWIYFTTLFGLNVLDYVEPKPGIPPTARHVAELIERIGEQDVRVLMAANYFERSKPQLIADRTGILPVVVPMSVGGEPGVDTYFDLVDLWITRLLGAFEKAYGKVESPNHYGGEHHGNHHESHRR
jgi:ABC-type Zn uptake system ZnuABC Zn-binding protein ZnuA